MRVRGRLDSTDGSVRVLSFDPGAKRLGWASLGRDGGRLYYHMSGVVYMHQNEMPTQEYRREIVGSLASHIPTLLDLTEPDEVAIEIVPAVGGGNFAVAVQSYLTHAAITAVETICYTAGLPVTYYGANTVQKRIAIRTKTKGRKVTKPMVRNGVIHLLPELEERKSDWVKIFEEPDALAVGLTHLGARNN